jgi:FkbM family methyltransferase
LKSIVQPHSENKSDIGKSALVIYPTLKTEQERKFWSVFCSQLLERGYNPIVISFLRQTEGYVLNSDRIFVPELKLIDKIPGFDRYGDETSGLLRLFFSDSVRAAAFESMLEMSSQLFVDGNGLTVDDLPRTSPRYNGYRRSGLVYIHYLLSIIELIRPRAVVVNNDTHPLHLLARMCADTIGIPAVYSERSPTITQWFEPLGFYKDSEIDRFMADGRWKRSGSHERRGLELIEQLRALPAGHRAAEQAIQSFKKNGSRPRIFLPLDHAIATGWSLPSHPLRLKNYPVLSTPEAAIDYFSGLAEKLGCELWVKAHPSEESRNTSFIQSARRYEHVSVTHGNFEEAIFTADVIVCFLTKTAYAAIALGKAVLTLGPNTAAVSGLTFHCNREDEIEMGLRQALENRRSGVDRNKLAARFLGYLDQQYFVSNDMRNPGANAMLERFFPINLDAKRVNMCPNVVTLAGLDPFAPGDTVPNRKSLIAGPFRRDEDRRLEEVNIVEMLFSNAVITLGSAQPVMFDVGACVGDAHKWFAEQGWTVHAFEPNPPMYQRIVDSLAPGVILNQLAVSDKSGEKVDFFTSKESIGISSMLAFRDTHEVTATVETVRLDDYCTAQGVEHIDFLKVDTEGFDLFVLKGLNWETHAPSVVICEFEDKKTFALDYTFFDLAGFLADRGYQVFVSEWHPITRYGAGEHRWRAMHSWPCDLFDANAWGNLIAFKTPIAEKLIRDLTNYNISLNFVDRAIKGKLKTPSIVSPALIRFGASSQADVAGFHLVPPPATLNWIGLKLPMAVSSGDKITSNITLYSAEAAKLQLSVIRFGNAAPWEGVRQTVLVEAGLNRFKVEAEFKHNHDYLLMQVGSLDNVSVQIGGLACSVEKVSPQSRYSSNTAPTTQKPLSQARAKLYVNLTSINFDQTLGVWFFAKQLLRSLAATKEFQIIGLATSPSSISSDVLEWFDELSPLEVCKHYRGGVELLLHHVQAPVTECPYVVVVHDLHFYDVPWKYSNPQFLQTNLQQLIGAAAAVLTEFPRTYFDLPKVIKKVPNAFFLTVSPSMHESKLVSQTMRATITAKYKLKSNTPLILYPAQLQKHKNHLSLFKAVKIVVQQQPALKVVCCGSSHSDEHTSILCEAIFELGLAETLFLPGRVDDEELLALYERADLVVSSSLAEGGAYIAQEAIERNKKVVVAAIRPALLHLRLMNATIPTFDPLYVDDIVNKITTALAEPQDNSASFSTIKSWTWELAASHYVAVLSWVHSGCPPGQIPPFASAETGIAIADHAGI